MGLDIYLYKCDPKTRGAKARYETESERLWEEAGDYDKLTDEQKEAIREKEKAFALSLGLNADGSNPLEKKIEHDSEQYPDHYFKIGYFRSSYNSSGIQRILRDMGLPDLDWVFDHNKAEYEFTPNWQQSLARIDELIAKFAEKGAYRVEAYSGNMFKAPEIHSEAEALEVFLNEISKDNRTFDSNYSNANGTFFTHEPLKVLALIPGTQTIFKQRECMYVITESSNEWYTQALEIVKATIEFVLSKEDKELYYFHWSG